MIKDKKHFTLLLVFFALISSIFFADLVSAQKRLCVKLEGTETDCSGGGAGSPGAPPGRPGLGCESDTCKAQAPRGCGIQSYTCNDGGTNFNCSTRANCMKCVGDACPKVTCMTSCDCETWPESTFTPKANQTSYCGQTGIAFQCGSPVVEQEPDAHCGCYCERAGNDTCVAKNSVGCKKCDCSNAGYSESYCMEELQKWDCGGPTKCIKYAPRVPGNYDAKNCVCTCPDGRPSLPYCGTDCKPCKKANKHGVCLD